MKTRNGFVSNSSSSSFVLIVKKEVHEKTMKQLEPYEKAVMNALISESKIFGQDVIYYGDLSVQDVSYTFEYLEVDWDDKILKDKYGDDISYYEVAYKYEKMVKKNKGDYFYWSQG